MFSDSYEELFTGLKDNACPGRPRRGENPQKTALVIYLKDKFLPDPGEEVIAMLKRNLSLTFFPDFKRKFMQKQGKKGTYEEFEREETEWLEKQFYMSFVSRDPAISDAQLGKLLH